MKNFNIYMAILTGLIAAILPASRNRKIKNQDQAGHLTGTATSVVERKDYPKEGSSYRCTIRVNGTLSTHGAGKVKQDEFYIPLSSVQNRNLPIPERRDQLVHHLQSPDFFQMALYPEVYLPMTKISPITGRGMYRAKQNLAFSVNTHPVVFPVKINGTDSLAIGGDTTIDRIKWGMT